MPKTATASRKPATRAPAKTARVKPAVDGVAKSGHRVSNNTRPMPLTRAPMKLFSGSASPHPTPAAHKPAPVMQLTRPPMKRVPGLVPRPTTAATAGAATTEEGPKFSVEGSTHGLKISILNHLKFSLARDIRTARPRDWWLCLCLSVRDRILERFITTQGTHNRHNVRRVYYLSLEYLMGRLLRDALHNTGLYEHAREAIEELGLDFERVVDEEVDMGLGNGGLGRLAACFLDSLATLDYPAVGYGIHYEYGLFKQTFVNGRQFELPDNWLRFGNPWQIVRPEYRVEVPLYGSVESRFDSKGDWKPVWVPGSKLLGIPWDIPIPGYGAGTVNFLRLWESRAQHEFDFQTFNQGGYVESVHEKAMGETVSKVLYPNDKTMSGKELRLLQQFFFVSCSMQDIIRRFRKQNETWDAFPDKVAVQLNDTHPAIGVAELMRILIDDNDLAWDEAWSICKKVFGYTNHTLLPEALEKWPVPLFERVLPRHIQIIYEINRRHLEEVERKWPGDGGKKTALSIIEEGDPKMVRMAYLAVAGSHSVNGVAELHTRLLKESLLHDFFELYPERFNNKTNGITPRRWLRTCNPELAALLDETLGGDHWTTKLELLRGLEKYAGDRAFQEKFMAVKRHNKEHLAKLIKVECGVSVDPTALFDVQVKRLHEYKRQHLNLLHILTLYRRLLHNPNLDIVPRVFIFGAKAAPGYDLAKDIIHAINAVGAAINRDPRINGKLKVAFVPNYCVTLAEQIIPAADLSEQISTAGKEASGTGNMKFALNGALTIGTLDGANIEMHEEFGDDNIFIFGLTVEQVKELWRSGYNPWDYYNSNEELRGVLDWLGSDYFTPDEPTALLPVRQSILEHGDPYLLCADYAAYIARQGDVDRAFRDRKNWARMAILNTARSGKFSSDRTIHEYAREIWHARPCPVGPDSTQTRVPFGTKERD
jgi:glycogen phosphorylase